MTDFDDPAQEVSSRDGAKTITKIRLACAQQIMRFEERVTGDPKVAILGSEIGESHPVSKAHSLTLLYYGELEAIMQQKMPGMWSGEALDEPIATVLVPKHPGVAGMTDYREETIGNFHSLESWSMKSVEMPVGKLGQQEQVRLFLSPDAIRQVYRLLKRVQSHLGLDATGKQERKQGTNEVDRL